MSVKLVIFFHIIITLAERTVVIPLTAPVTCMLRVQRCLAQRSVSNKLSIMFIVNLLFVSYKSSSVNVLVCLNHVICSRVKSCVERIFILKRFAWTFILFYFILFYFIF